MAGDAIADGFKIANGFLPVIVFPPPEPTRLLVPDDLSVSFMILFAAPVDELLEPFFLFSISGSMRASDLNCSMLKRTSLILSLVTVY